MAAETIDAVIEHLDELIVGCRDRGSRLGYFPALYRKVTVAVKEGIARGQFEDGARMEQLDVIFANLYLTAVEQWQQEKQPSASWHVAFQAAQHWPPIVLQHLLLGINAHINLDLGIAAARTAPGDALPALRNDFDRINAILAAVTVGVKEKMRAIWPLLRLYDAWAGNLEDGLIYFSLARARRHAWQVAERLAYLDEADRPAVIDAVDRRAARLGRIVWKPPVRTRLLLLGVRLGERGTTQEIIELLT